MNYLTSDNFLTAPLWFDQPDAEQQLQGKLRSGTINQADADLISNFRKDGYAIVDIDGIDGAIKSLLDGVEDLWANPPFDLACAGPGHVRPLPMTEGVSIFGREPGVRLMDIHSHVAGAQQLYLNEQLHRLCGILFGAQAIATQSLYFEYGSTQSLHRDPWYVNHNPRSHLLAAWFALEDIHPDSGPLNYVAGSHKLPYFRFKTDDIVFHDRRVTDQERHAAIAAMQGQIAANGLRREAALPKRGQVFLWHGSLIHGGSPVINPALTRRSLVVHFGRVDTHPERGGGLFYEGANRTFFTTKVCTNEAGMRGWENPLVGITPEDFLPQPNGDKPTRAVAPPTSAPVNAACPICGCAQFGAGPGGRMSVHGKAPRCLKCGALEIQRANHLVFGALPADFMNWRRALQIGVGTGLDVSHFLSLDSLPAPSAGKPVVLAAAQGQYDLISMNQVFEYVEDDLGLLAEVVCRMTPRSILHVCFSGIAGRVSSMHGEAGGGVHHLYGADVLSHFNCSQLGLHDLAVQVEDPCTGTQQIVHLFVKDLPDLAMLRQCFKLAKNETMRLL